MACGKVSLPGNFSRTHFTGAKERLSGAGGWHWAEKKITREELELVYRATVDAEARLARELGLPATRTREDLAAHNEKLKAVLKKQGKLFAAVRHRIT